MATPNDSRRSTPSLLLQPPTSGYSWDSSGGSSFLLPVVQPDDSSVETDGGESDSFIGQTPMPPPPQIGGLSGQSGHSAFTPVVSSNMTSKSVSPLSQLQQPLRPIQSKSLLASELPEPPIRQPSVPGQYTTTPMANVSPMPPSTAQNTYGNFGPPPPTGPTQNFRRQTPLAYAPMPDISNSPQHSSLYNSPITQSVPESSPPLPPFQSYNPAFETQSCSQPEGSHHHHHQHKHHHHQQPQQQGNEPFYNPQNQTQTSEPTIGQAFSSFNSYKPVQSHWFYRKEVESKELWLPFSVIDSTSLEEVHQNGETDAIVPTDGGRYDVYLGERLRKSVYWEEAVCIVKRSSWFYRAEGQNRYVPYDEVVAEKIEECYREGLMQNRWPQKLELEGVSEAIVMQNPQEVAHYLPSKLPDEWGYVPEGQMTLRVVKRGVSEILTVDEGETRNIDHLVFLVQGVGAVCDLKFRSVVECVDDFRAMGLNLTQTHFESALSSKQIGRVEILPIAWHASLHGDATGIDGRMQKITLPSIPKLRHFTNDTVMDIFFYTSPIYCQTIVDTVGSELNRIFQIFKNRNPDFDGGISVAGHSLGSLILFDILAHQLEPDSPHHTRVSPSQQEPEILLTSEEDSDKTDVKTLESVLDKLGLDEYIPKFQYEKIDLDTLMILTEAEFKEMGLPMGPRVKILAFIKEQDEKKKAEASLPVPSSSQDDLKGIPWSQSNASLVNRQDSIASINYMVGVAGTGQPSVVYPKLSFQPSCFFAFGSPIAMFLTVRGIQTIGDDYQLPTCPAFFNIFHPYDPVAFRMETLIDPQLNIKPVLIPHHKGRKRLHLELRDSLTRVGTDIKQKLIDSLRHTWNSISDFARAHRSSAEQIEAELNRVVQEQLDEQRKEMEDEESTATADVASQEDIQIGQLNGGRRIDYVLQEKPIESFNQYLFALASHTCYWESEDTALMLIKEVYSLKGIFPKSQSSNGKITLYNPAVSRSTINQPSQSNPFGEYQNTNTPNFGYANVNKNFPIAMVAPQERYNEGVASMGANQQQNTGPPPLQGFVRGSPLVKR